MPAYIWPINQALLIRRGFRASLLLLLIVGQAAFTFLQRGYTRVFALQGGWKAWQQAGYPLADK